MLALLAETFKVATRTDQPWYQNWPSDDRTHRLETRQDHDRWFWRGRRAGQQ